MKTYWKIFRMLLVATIAYKAVMVVILIGILITVGDIEMPTWFHFMFFTPIALLALMTLPWFFSRLKFIVDEARDFINDGY